MAFPRNSQTRLQHLERVDKAINEERRLRIVVDQVLQTDNPFRRDAHEHLRRQRQRLATTQQELPVVLPALLLATVEFEQNRVDVVQVAVISACEREATITTLQMNRCRKSRDRPPDGTQSPLPLPFSSIRCQITRSADRKE